MLLKLCNSSEGVFRSEFRKQLLATLSVTIITYCNGISLGWFAPMVTKIQSPIETPHDFSASVEEGSWLGAVVCAGGVTGNIVYGLLLDLIGRKLCIYLLAVPHICFWILVYFAPSIEYLYAARFASGMTGGGTWVVIPIYIGEIADPSIRGRLTSLFTLTLNAGMLTGYILASYVPYHWIPIVVLPLPVLFLLIEFYLPETPSYLLRCEQEALAENSLKFYMNYKASAKLEIEQFNMKFAELKNVMKKQNTQANAVTIRDFFTKRALKSISIGITLMFIYTFSGTFALLSYMSSIFAAIKTDVHPDTNTVIVGVVQIVGAYMAISLVDRYGRKILLMTSTAAVGICLSSFGMYAYLAEKTSVDLTAYRTWLPVMLVALIILTANMGLLPVPPVVMVEVQQAKIRSKAVSFCVTISSALGFVMLKIFLPFLHAYGLAATMWACASFAAFGLLYVTLFVPETKGKSMNTDEEK
ncbi:facilitated trehalose transporter Tret1-2 homolog [Rhagoletis pomonella]|uniref:facilitated trehalose transporter Tret1-2 homolog n=1 Tax=Rhagoletis pomonella TaxID=28610 RepID=UPI0017876323|nr:facilitated trehalose transporter Tret1-2 homolog [Rhagoletis pomonella]